MAYGIDFIEITNAGGTFTIDNSVNTPDIVLLKVTPSVVLANDVTIDFSNTPSNTQILFFWVWTSGDIDLNGHNFSLCGQSYSQEQVEVPAKVLVVAADVSYTQYYTPKLSMIESLSGLALKENSIAYNKLLDGTAGNILVANASGVWTERTVSGDITVDPVGAAFIGANKITNTNINTSAAIARSKMASGTASHVVINDGSGVFSSEAQLAASRGGTALDTSASTGFATVSAGTWSVGSISYCIQVPVSWESGEQCNNRVKIPFAGTITNIYAVVTKALAGSDAGTIVPKNAAATNMTLTSALSFAASSALETAIDTNVSANNTVAANDIIYLTTAKTTAGGKALVSITITRTS